MFDPGRYSQLIADVDAATTSNAKGAAFEALCEYLFGELDGVDVVERDASMPAEEIDLVLWNAGVEEELRPLDPIIFVECKNWSKAVGAPVLDNFIAKLRRRRLKTGIFIAANGVTGTFNVSGERGACGIINSALQEGLRIIVLEMSDLRSITSIDDLKALLKKRFCGIFVRKVLN